MRAAMLLAAALAIGPAVLGTAPAGAKFLDDVLARPVVTLEPGKDAGTDLSLRRNGEVSRVRALPAKVVAVAADVTVDQAVILHKGDALALYRTTGGSIFCATGAARPGAFVAKVPCLFDSDGDGKFDQTMRIGITDTAGPFRSAIIVRGSPIAVTPVGSTPLDPADHALFAPVRIVFTGGGSNNASFVVMLGEGKTPITINGSQARGKGSFPFDVEILGARLTILGYDKGTTRLRIAEPVPAQPFLLSGGLF